MQRSGREHSTGTGATKTTLCRRSAAVSGSVAVLLGQGDGKMIVAWMFCRGQVVIRDVSNMGDVAIRIQGTWDVQLRR